MKKASIIALILALPLFFAGDFLGSTTLGALLSQSGFRFVTLYQRQVNADVVVLGNSRAKFIFNAAEATEIGIPSFNLAANGLGYRVSEALLLDYIDRNQAPKFVLFDLMSTKADNDYGAINNLKLFSGQSRRIAALWAEHDPVASTWGRYIRTFRYNGEAFVRALSFWGHSDQGYTNALIMPETLCSQGNLDDKWLTHGLTADRVSRLTDLSNQLKAQNSRLVLIASPVYLNSEVRSEKLAEAMKDAQHRLGDIPLLDFSAALQECRNFGDTIHLNTAGTAELTALIVDRIGRLE